MLGDEFTPDGCRLWDAKTGEKLDKDRFRRDLGSVIEHYREVGTRIGAPLVDSISLASTTKNRPAGRLFVARVQIDLLLLVLGRFLDHVGLVWRRSRPWPGRS